MQYYSEKTRKLYVTEKELKDAEKEFDAKERELQKIREAKSARAKEIEDAYQAIQAANKKYNELVNAFIKDYGSYHYSVSQKINTPKSLVDVFFNNWPF